MSNNCYQNWHNSLLIRSKFKPVSKFKKINKIQDWQVQLSRHAVVLCGLLLKFPTASWPGFHLLSAIQLSDEHWTQFSLSRTWLRKMFSQQKRIVFLSRFKMLPSLDQLWRRTNAATQLWFLFTWVKFSAFS